MSSRYVGVVTSESGNVLNVAEREIELGEDYSSWLEGVLRATKPPPGHLMTGDAHTDSPSRASLYIREDANRINWLGTCNLMSDGSTFWSAAE